MSAVRPRATLLLAVLAAFVAALFLSPTPLRAASLGETLLTGWADSLRAAGAEVRWASLVETGDDRIELAEVEIRIRSAEPERSRITVPRIAFVGLAPRPDGGFTARSIALPRLELTGTSRGDRVTIAVTDVDITALDAPRLVVPPFDADAPLASAIDRSHVLDGLALAHAAIGRIAVTGTLKPHDRNESITFEDVSFDGLAGGRLDRFRLGRLAIEAPADDRQGRFTVEAFEAEGLDPGAWSRVFDDRTYVDGRGDGLWRPYLAAVRTGRVLLDVGDAAISIERFSSGPRSIRPFPEPLGGIIGRFAREPDSVPPADALRVFLELYLATRHDGWSIDGLRITGADLDHAEIGRFALGPFTPEGLSELAVERVDVASRKAILRLGRFVLADLRLPDAEDLRRAIPAALAGAEIDPSSLAPTLGSLALEGLELAEPGVPSIRLALFRLDLSRHLRAIPTVLALTVDHLVVPAGLADADGRATLAGLGYDRVDVSLAGRLEWLEAKRELVLEGGRLAVTDLGEATVAARLTGVPRSLFLRPDTLPLTLGGIGLAEATATLTDASFGDRLVRLLAKDARMKPEKVRRRLADEVVAEMRAIRDPVRRKAIAAAVRDFLLRPTSITFAARPKRPLALPELMPLRDDLATAAEKLELSVTTAK